ncbi:hypothetical protein IJK16_01280 [Candidatus Saccharibacteria bacterium]|nr:hypothetical protein [Candidatus Saccharibacteria bacterium]
MSKKYQEKPGRLCPTCMWRGKLSGDVFCDYSNPQFHSESKNLALKRLGVEPESFDSSNCPLYKKGDLLKKEWTWPTPNYVPHGCGRLRGKSTYVDES